MKTATRTCEPSARDIVLARNLHAIFELDDVRARKLLVEVCSNAWAPPHGPSACTRRKLMLVPARQIGHMSRFGAAARRVAARAFLGPRRYVWYPHPRMTRQRLPQGFPGSRAGKRTAPVVREWRRE